MSHEETGRQAPDFDRMQSGDQLAIVDGVRLIWFLLHEEITRNRRVRRTFVAEEDALSHDDVTLASGATSFKASASAMTITGDGGGNTIGTITDGQPGQVLSLVFVDGNVTVTDDDTHGADSIDLSASFTSADDTTLTLVYDGTSWYELSRSTN